MSERLDEAAELIEQVAELKALRSATDDPAGKATLAREIRMCLGRLADIAPRENGGSVAGKIAASAAEQSNAGAPAVRRKGLRSVG